MRPEKTAFACSVNFLSNIDFFEILNNKIELTKSLRLGNLISVPAVERGGMFYSVDLTEDTQVGYINLTGTVKYVYALYSDKKMLENDRKSNVVLVYE